MNNMDHARATLTLHVSKGNYVVITLEACVDDRDVILYRITSMSTTDVYYDPGYAPGALFRDVRNLDANTFLAVDKQNDCITVRRIAKLDDGTYTVRQKYVTWNIIGDIVFKTAY